MASRERQWLKLARIAGRGLRPPAMRPSAEIARRTGVGTANAVCLMLSVVLCACASGSQTPRIRLGSTPFPGLLSLYAAADPRDLGMHRYEPWWERLVDPDETSWGNLYTCRAGFLDLGHLREYVDWARYIHDRAGEVLRGGGESFS
ncbi:MAG TPA: DUF4056 domain-containing protein, partial [Candidatus Methylomirabilis sp.]|nr:DUF4056 domain-containing protein [Candidatus Methylomirabilis sp.]